jgi:hypothetical protein
MKEFRLPSTGGVLGYGFPEALLTVELQYGAQKNAQENAPVLDLEIPL